jgi:hypothetical protein
MVTLRPLYWHDKIVRYLLDMRIDHEDRLEERAK